jgi:hypothetical protein
MVDCNANHLPDSCDIVNGTAFDCNENGVLDECDLASGNDVDCNKNDIPDTCESVADCNLNGIRDICEIAEYPKLDCNQNNLLDKCESTADCNANDQLDMCEIFAGAVRDCNGNSVPDACDVAGGEWDDDDHDGVPDACQVPVPAAAAWGSRYLGVTPALAPDVPLALVVRGDAGDPDVSCVQAYVQADGRLGATPAFQRPSEWATVAAADVEILPGKKYWVFADYGAPGDPHLSLPVAVETWTWGDVDGSGQLDLIDLLCVQDVLSGNTVLCSLYGMDLMGAVPDGLITVDDLLALGDALAGLPYPGPAPCP